MLKIKIKISEENIVKTELMQLIIILIRKVIISHRVLYTIWLLL